MESRVNYKLVGIFVILSTLMLFGFIYWMAKFGQSNIKYDYYQFFTTESVAGLDVESAVKYKGFDVGSVAKIEIDENNSSQIRVILKIKQNTPIKDSDLASLECKELQV